MAGDEKEIGTELPDILIDDPFERLAALLAKQGGASERIYAELASVGYEIVGPFVGAAALTSGAAVSQHIRFRVRHVIISTDVASTITLLLGAAAYPFVMDNDGGPQAIPFPLVIERGTDMSFSASVASTFACYLVGRPE